MSQWTSGDGFHNHTGTTARDGPPIRGLRSYRPSVGELVADGVHVALVNREGGFPVAVKSRGALLIAIDACVDELGAGATRRLLLQAARALK